MKLNLAAAFALVVCLLGALAFGGYQAYDLFVNKAKDLSPVLIIGVGALLAGAIISFKFVMGADAKGTDHPSAPASITTAPVAVSDADPMPASAAPIPISGQQRELVMERDRPYQPQTMTPNLACPNCGTIMEIPQNTFDRLFQLEQGVTTSEDEEAEPPDFDKYYDDPVLDSNEAMKRRWYAEMEKPVPVAKPEPPPAQPVSQAKPQPVRVQPQPAPAPAAEPEKKKGGLFSMLGLKVKVKPKPPEVDKVDKIKAEMSKKAIGNLPRYETEQDLVLKRKIEQLRK